MSQKGAAARESSNSTRRRIRDFLWMMIGTSTSTIVSGTFAAVLAWRRDAVTVSAFFGAIANGLLSKILKKLIQQSRPSPSHNVHDTSKVNDDDNDDVSSDFSCKYGIGEEEGMPSSHSMSLGFVWCLTALHYPSETSAGEWPSSKLVFISASLVYVLVSATYRIHAKLHTWQQVVVGLSLGIVHAWLFVQYLEADLSVLITKYVLTDNGHDGEPRVAAPLLVIPFVVAIMIGAKADKRIMQWLGKILHKKKKTR